MANRSSGQPAHHYLLGRMVIPIGPDFDQALCVVDKHPGGKVSVERKIAVRYVPLTEKRAQESGELF
jgi:protein-L-isoaspartate O-methyltransferase